MAARALLVLEDGRTFRGEAYGAEGETFGEAVFNTGMTGYQETLTDPSYHRQVVVMTAPHIGNTGVNDEDQESRRIWVAGLRRARPRPGAVQLALAAHPRRRAARAGRRRHLRRRHPRADPPPARARRDAGRHLHDRDRPRGAAGPGARVEPRWPAPSWPARSPRSEAYVVPRRRAESGSRVAALDLGIKGMTPAMMAERGIEVHVLPATASLDDVLARCDARTGCSSPTAPATRPPPTVAGRAAAGRAGARAAVLRHLLRQPAVRPRARASAPTS